MPKMKSVKSATKRFKVRKNSIKRGTAFRSHLLSNRTSKRMRSLRHSRSVHSANLKLVQNMLCD